MFRSVEHGVYVEPSHYRQKDIPQAADEQLRLYDMKARWRTDAVQWDASVLDSLNHLQYYKDTEWQTCTPDNAARFRR